MPGCPRPPRYTALPRISAARALLLSLCLCSISYAQDQKAYIDRELSFNSGPNQIHATLCLPAPLHGGVPVIVFVHAENPLEVSHRTDVDAVFRALAHRLAQAQIASLLYWDRGVLDSKPRVLDRVVTRDAVAALRFAATLPEINSSAEFVFGHSVGGTMAPYVAEQYPQLRGVILSAAAVAPIDRSILRQQRLVLNAEGNSERQIQVASDSQAKILADIRSGKIPASRMISGAPASYWRDWMSRDPIGELAHSKLPVLVIQDEQDAANDTDSERLQPEIEAMGPRAQLRLLPGLDRFFVSGESTQSPESAQLTEIISRWILRIVSGK